MRKIVFLLVLLALLIWGCGAPPKKPAPASVKIVDSAGKIIEVPKPITKLVVLHTDALWALRAIGASEKVVGVPKYVFDRPSLWEPFLDRANIGTCFKPNYEKIIELNPDVVIAYVKWPGSRLEEKLEPAGIKVVRLDFYHPTEMEREIKTLGLMLGLEDGAERYAEAWRKPLEMVGKRVKGIKKKVKVYYESWTPWKSCGVGSGWHEMIEIAGGLNIARKEPSPYPKLSPEYVLEVDPDVIIKTPSSKIMGYGKEDIKPVKAVYDELINRAGIKGTKAVREGRVYLMSPDLTGGAWKNIAILQIAKWLYPDKFRDIEPLSYYEEMLKEFFGLERRGIFTYPGE